MTSRFLFVTWEGGGTLPPELAIAQRLMARGHQVAMLAEPPSRAEIEAAGFRFEGYHHAPVRASRDPADDPFRDWEKNPLSAVKAVLDAKACGPARAYARDIGDTLERWPADVLVVDAYLLGAVVGALGTGLPTVAVNADLGLRPIEGRPPYGPGLAPATGLLGRLRDWLITTVQRRVMARGLPPLNAAARAAGLEPLDSPFDALDRVDWHLLLSSRSFDYAVEPPDNLRYVGPQLDDPIWTGSWTPPWPHEDRPLVLLSLGSTFQDQADLYRRAIDALAGQPVRALVTLGDVLDPRDFEAPDNVQVVASAPHTAVLQHAALSISHCGHGSVMRSLAAGVPLVCLPIGRDQMENAARVAAHGAGVRLGPGATPKRIRRAVHAVLDDPSYSRRAGDLATAIASESEDDPAVTTLEQLADSSSGGDATGARGVAPPSRRRSTSR